MIESLNRSSGQPAADVGTGDIVNTVSRNGSPALFFRQRTLAGRLPPATVGCMSSYDLPGMEALVFVRLPAFGFDPFERFLGDEVDVVAAWHVVGDVDVVVNVRCRDLTELENLVDRMRAAGGATGTSVHLILRPATLSVRDYVGEVERRSGAATSEPVVANTGPVVRSRRRLTVGR